MSIIIVTLRIVIHRMVVAGSGRFKGLIYSGLVRLVLLRGGVLISREITASGRINLCRKNGRKTSEYAYQSDMHRSVKEAIKRGKMIVFVSHGCKNIQQ